MKASNIKNRTVLSNEITENTFTSNNHIVFAKDYVEIPKIVSIQYIQYLENTIQYISSTLAANFNNDIKLVNSIFIANNHHTQPIIKFKLPNNDLDKAIAIQITEASETSSSKIFLVTSFGSIQLAKIKSKNFNLDKLITLLDKFGFKQNKSDNSTYLFATNDYTSTPLLTPATIKDINTNDMDDKLSQDLNQMFNSLIEVLNENNVAKIADYSTITVSLNQSKAINFETMSYKNQTQVDSDTSNKWYSYYINNFYNPISYKIESLKDYLKHPNAVNLWLADNFIPIGLGVGALLTTGIGLKYGIGKSASTRSEALVSTSTAIIDPSSSSEISSSVIGIESPNAEAKSSFSSKKQQVSFESSSAIETISSNSEEVIDPFSSPDQSADLRSIIGMKSPNARTAAKSAIKSKFVKKLTFEGSMSTPMNTKVRNIEAPTTASKLRQKSSIELSQENIEQDIDDFLERIDHSNEDKQIAKEMLQAYFENYHPDGLALGQAFKLITEVFKKKTTLNLSREEEDKSMQFEEIFQKVSLGKPGFKDDKTIAIKMNLIQDSSENLPDGFTDIRAEKDINKAYMKYLAVKIGMALKLASDFSLGSATEIVDDVCYAPEDDFLLMIATEDAAMCLSKDAPEEVIEEICLLKDKPREKQSLDELIYYNLPYYGQIISTASTSTIAAYAIDKVTPFYIRPLAKYTTTNLINKIIFQDSKTDITWAEWSKTLPDQAYQFLNDLSLYNFGKSSFNIYVAYGSSNTIIYAICPAGGLFSSAVSLASGSLLIPYVTHTTDQFEEYIADKVYQLGELFTKKSLLAELTLTPVQNLLNEQNITNIYSDYMNDDAIPTAGVESMVFIGIDT